MIAATQPRLSAWLRHLGCILLLMWVPLANGQPFFFPDTTAYVRAGDYVAKLISHGHLRTAWTAHYDAAPAPAGATPATPVDKAADSVSAGGNDLRNGNIMAGRSPYFGVLLYAGYLLGDFWPFVVAQAVCAYALITLSLRRFGLASATNIVTVVGLLAATVSLPFYDGLLLADALAAFGILAFLLLATDRGTLSRGETLFLGLLLLVSVSAHMTHIAMLAAMLALLVVARLLRLAPPLTRIALVAGIGGLAAGLASVWLTSAVIRHVFDKPPQLAPLMTARFIDDGPGADFVRAGCGGKAFVACRHLPEGDNSDVYLWSHDPRLGGYLPLDAASRARMASEDTAFAMAVLRAHPVRQPLMMARNTLAQLAEFPLTGLNEGCFADRGCWASLPPNVRDRMRHTPGGRNAWPVPALNLLLYAVVIVSLAVLAALASALRRTARGRDLLLWCACTAAAMLACAFLGGAVSSPQWRYQGRLVWLIPFLAAIAVLLWRDARRLTSPNSAPPR